MAGLLDIAPVSRTVEVQGTKIEVGGISALGVAHLLQRFPVIRELLAGRDVELTPDTIFEIAPDAVKVIIAAGCGNHNSDEAEEAAEKLAVGDQLNLLSAIIDATLPDGINPFVEKLQSLLSQTGAEAAVSGKVRGTKSPSPSKS